MPELPEVETIVRGLNRELAGRTVSTVEVHFPSVIRSGASAYCARVSASRLERVDRHGKSILFRLSPATGGAFTLRFHLGMTGQLLLCAPSEPVASHTHIVVRFEGGERELRFRDMRRFGWTEILSDQRTLRLGPDAWTTPVEELYARLRSKSGMLKHGLLNQSVVAGLGNIYVDEALYRCGLHPRRDLGDLAPRKLRELCEAIKAVLGESIAVGGTSFRNYVDTEGSRGGFKGRLRIYGRTGQACACGGTIRRFVVAGRGTHVCLRCQRPPRRSAARFIRR